MAPLDPVRGHRAPPDAVLRRAPGHVRLGTRRHRASTRAPPGYQLAQRSDFFEVEVGLETTLKRPIINTRDEPHAVADRYRRLHVILGDANHCDVANLLKIGSTSPRPRDDRGPRDARRPLGAPPGRDAARGLARPDACRPRSSSSTARQMTALELLLGVPRPGRRLRRTSGPAASPTPTPPRSCTGGATVLDRLARDPMDAPREVDWVAKPQVLEGYRDRDGLDWGDPRLQGRRHPVVRRAPRQGAVPPARGPRPGEVLVDEADVDAAVDEPPTDTRAWFRGSASAIRRPRSRPRRGTR